MINNYFLACKNLKGVGSDEEQKKVYTYEKIKVFDIGRKTDVEDLKRKLNEIDEKYYDDDSLWELLQDGIKDFLDRITFSHIDTIKYLIEFNELYRTNNLSLIDFMLDIDFKDYEGFVALEFDTELHHDRIVIGNKVYRSNHIEWFY